MDGLRSRRDGRREEIGGRARARRRALLPPGRGGCPSRRRVQGAARAGLEAEGDVRGPREHDGGRRPREGAAGDGGRPAAVTESSLLAARLAARIRRKGPLRFDVFQEAALYDPDGGYYERPGRVGRAGDFVTGPSWHPAFGRTIARIAKRLWEEEGEISEKGAESRPRGTRALMDGVDVGAGEGELLRAADEALWAWGIREDFRL